MNAQQFPPMVDLIKGLAPITTTPVISDTEALSKAIGSLYNGLNHTLDAAYYMQVQNGDILMKLDELTEIVQNLPVPQKSGFGAKTVVVGAFMVGTLYGASLVLRTNKESK